MDEAEQIFTLARQKHFSGNLREAEALYRRILEILPNEPNVLHMLAVVLHQRRDNAAALPLLHQAIKVNPSDASYFNTLGIINKAIGNLQDAEAAFGRVVEFQPRSPEAHFNLAAIRAELNKDELAIASNRAALQLRPSFPEAMVNLGYLLTRMGKSDEAVSVFEKAIAIQPNFPDAHYNLGCARIAQGRFQDAEIPLQRAVSLKQDHAEAYYHLGIVKLEQNRPAEAAAAFKRALAIKPRYGEAAWNLAWVHLMNGEFREGWRAYESRWSAKKHFYLRDHVSPLWDGSDLSGRRILVHCEQGFGDVLQMARFLPMLRDRGANVIVQCQPELKTVLTSVPGVEQIVALDETLPQVDVHCPFMSLPGRFDVTLQSIPARVPYLAADPAKAERWKQSLSDETRLKVGLVWAGRANPPHRSIEPTLLSALTELNGVRFYGLQVGENGQPVESAPEKLTDLAPDLHDFSDTAALLMNLDLLITIDTAVAHLAGALARPVWVLLRHNPDWRWLLNREDSPWYPTMRLFRQQMPRDWVAAIERVKEELMKLSNSPS